MGKKDNTRSITIKTSDQSEEISGTDRLQILTFLRLFQTGKNVFLAKKRRPANGKTREKSGHMTLSAVRGKRILYFIILFAKVSKPLSWKKKNNRFWVRRLLDLSSETGTWSFILTKQVTNICPTGSSCTVKHLNIFTLISACTWIQTKCFLLSTNISIATFFTKDDHF